jgi:hypothetical protein
MCATLHLLLGTRQPHELPSLHITRTHILALHRALLEWLLMGTTPALWQLGCLPPDIHPPASAHTGPYPLLIITVTTSLTKGPPWRPERSIHVGSSSTIAWPSPAIAEPPSPHPTELSSSAPTGRLSSPQPLIETQSLPPQIPGPAPSEADPLENAYMDGQMSPTPPSPTPGPETTTTPILLVAAPPKRGLFDGPLLSNGTVHVRLA